MLPLQQVWIEDVWSLKSGLLCRGPTVNFKICNPFHSCMIGINMPNVKKCWEIFEMNKDAPSAEQGGHSQIWRGPVNQQLLMSPLPDRKGMHNMYQYVFFARPATICRQWKLLVKCSARQTSVSFCHSSTCKSTRNIIQSYDIVASAKHVKSRPGVLPRDAQRFLVGPTLLGLFRVCLGFT